MAQPARPSTGSTLLPRAALFCLLGSVMLGCAVLSGCAALSNPGVQAIPVRLLPPEMRGKSVEGLKPIPLSLLGQPHPPAYLIDAGDVLGIWVEGVLGDKNQPPPVQPSLRLNNVDLPPSLGYPFEVRQDGTISLPLLDSLKLGGMTFKDAEQAIRGAYVKAGVLKADKDSRVRISVSLIRPRTYHILVLRQDSPMSIQSVVTSQLGMGGPEFIGVARKGTGWELTLPAYQNDVLTALAKTGGLPGTDAVDAVVVERNTRQSLNWDMVMQSFQAGGPPVDAPGCPLVRIPLRVSPGAPLPIQPQDVVLHDGDVVFIPAREERLFFTGGLMPPGEHILPRDKDLDVLEAVARVRGVMFNGAFAVSNLTGTVIMPGLGQPSPSLLTVVRRLPNSCGGGQISIRVDLNHAVKDARERLLVQANDFLILQETPAQAITRYATQMFDVPFVWKFAQTSNMFGAMALSAPGGTAPTTVSPMGFGVYQSSIVQQTPTTTSVTPFATSVGR
jgi:protein involved in polysaccharide export with SLBB domain